jgi:hypothetical protein
MAGPKALPLSVKILINKIFKNDAISSVKAGQFKKLKLGNPVLFKYSAKTARDLPYWDALPLAIVLAKYPDGFLGLSLHYVPWAKRLQLADRLIRATKNKSRISYGDIKAAWNALRLPAGFAYLIIRRYLATHIRSDIKTFTWEDYRPVVLNTRGKWRKASEQEVFKAMTQKWAKHVRAGKEQGKKVTRTKGKKRKRK